MHYRLRSTLQGQAKQMFAYGRAETFLARRHGDRPPTAGKLAIKQARLLCVLPRYLFSPVGRGQWVRSFSMSAGRLAEEVSRRLPGR